MNRFTFTRSAERDVEAIATYLRTLPKAPALRIGRDLQRTIELITTHPHMGKVDSRLTSRSSKKILRFPSGDYVVFYFLDHAGICIIGVLHGRRDTRSIMQNRVE